MATLATVRAKIASVLQDDSLQSVSAANVDAIINDSIAFYKHQAFWFNEAKADLVCVTGDPVLSGLPSDFLCELSHGGLTLFYANVYYGIEKVSTESYDSRNISALGLPRVYTFRNNQIELYPYPNLAFDIKLRYVKDYAELVGDNDTNDFLTHMERVIRLDALSRIYFEFKQDKNMSATYAEGATSELEAVKRRSNVKAGSGTLVIDSVLF